MGDSCKPDEIAFTKVLDDIGDVRPENCAMFEDSFRNVVMAKQLGMRTIFVTGHDDTEQGLTELTQPDGNAADGNAASPIAPAAVADLITDRLSLDHLSPSRCPFLWHRL